LTSQKSLRINLPPFIDLIFPEIVTTFGLKIDSPLPEFTDYEGDEVHILVDDVDNYELGLHAHWKGEGMNGQKQYSVQSFTL